jgi:hypothetical protein
MGGSGVYPQESSILMKGSSEPSSGDLGGYPQESSILTAWIHAKMPYSTLIDRFIVHLIAVISMCDVSVDQQLPLKICTLIIQLQRLTIIQTAFHHTNNHNNMPSHAFHTAQSDTTYGKPHDKTLVHMCVLLLYFCPTAVRLHKRSAICMNLRFSSVVY